MGLSRPRYFRSTSACSVSISVAEKAARHDLVHVPLDRVAGRQLADEEREQRNRPDSEDAENDSPRNIGQHWLHLVGSRRPLCQMRIWTPTHLHGRSGTSGRRYGRPLPRQGPHSGHGPTCHALCGKSGRRAIQEMSISYMCRLSGPSFPRRRESIPSFTMLRYGAGNTSMPVRPDDSHHLPMSSTPRAASTRTILDRTCKQYYS